MLESSRVAAQLAASQEGLSSMRMMMMMMMVVNILVVTYL
jgi:hypothetical protein